MKLATATILATWAVSAYASGADSLFERGVAACKAPAGEGKCMSSKKCKGMSFGDLCDGESDDVEVRSQLSYVLAS